MSDLIETPAPTDSMAFYALANDSVYESVRAQLDAAFGHPKPGTVTCIAPVANALHDAQGRPIVALEYSQLAWPEVAAARDSLIANGYAVEITRADWEAAQTGS